MIAGRPRTTALGGLPIMSFVVQKLEPLGTDFKTSTYPVTGVMTMMEIHRNKGGMKEKRCKRELFVATACAFQLIIQYQLMSRIKLMVFKVMQGLDQ